MLLIGTRICDDRPMRITPALLLILFALFGRWEPASATEAKAAVPQPLLLDWTGQFRLNAPPNNADPSRVKAAQAAAEARRDRAPARAPGASAAVTPDERARGQTSYRTFASDRSSLNVKAPVDSGPVSVGASYGSRRVIPTTREIEAHDARISLGLAF